MISDLMVYGTKIALLVGLGGLALERVAAWRRLPRRAVWTAALMVSLAVPALGLITRPQRVESSGVSTNLPSVLLAPQRIEPRAARTMESVSSSAVLAPPQQENSSKPQRATVERILLSVWLTASAGLVLFHALLWLRLQIAARNWRCDLIDDQVVWVSAELGPAVCGILDPKILMPQWILGTPRQTRALVMAHEREHIAARDPALLLLGRLMVVIAPWNLPLWWQLRRLRFAIEVDCDARVLAHGETVNGYGEALLAVGARRSLIPVGATALTEPASQLRRRVLIMTAAIPKRGKWAVAATIGFALASLVIAADLQAPAIHAKSMTQELAPTALRKLPLGVDARQGDIQNLVRSTYPELFGASAKAGRVLVTLLLNPDGTLYKSVKEDVNPRPWIRNSLHAFEVMGVDYEHRGAGVKLRMQNSTGADGDVDVRAWYFEAPADPTRDVATVRAQVKARYATLFKPAYSDGSRRVTPEGISVLTVYMTETGAIDRANVEDLTGDPDALARPERFVTMGIARAQIGPIGAAEFASGHYTDDDDVKILQVIYAWPRRPHEIVPMREAVAQPVAAGPNDDPAVNRAIAEHYFPDLYTYPKEWPRADPWVLLDRQGKVLTTGRRVGMSGRDIQLYVESLYPGIRTDQVQITTIQGGSDQSSDIGFVWLAADSPVTDLSNADLSARNAVLLYADVIGEGMTRPTELLSLKIGSPAVTVCSLKNPFGVVHVEVTALEVAADAVTARVRIQQTPLPATSQMPSPLESAWSPEGRVVRARFGRSTDLQVTDQNGKVWRLVLHPERLKAA